MKIGKSTVPQTAISTSDEHTIVVRGEDLCADLIGKIGFTEYYWLLLTGERPTAVSSAVLNATLVAIAEHGLVPSVQASRMTYAAAPDALQGAVVAGILGCGSVILGASQDAGRLFAGIAQRMSEGVERERASREAVQGLRKEGKAIPGYGHPLHKERDPRVSALFAVARESGAELKVVRIAEEIESQLPTLLGKALQLNVSAAIPAVLLGVGFPVQALKGVPILARTAGLLAHLYEEAQQPSGFALSYQATRETEYLGEVPAGFKKAQKSGSGA